MVTITYKTISINIMNYDVLRVKLLLVELLYWICSRCIISKSDHRKKDKGQSGHFND